MKIGIMQPYFFPYLGYFSLIKYIDKWIVFDSVQYIRHGWINRNRILKHGGGWQYIIVPLKKHDRSTLIKDIIISEDNAWKDRIFGQLEYYKKIAPYYDQVTKLLKECLQYQTSSITHLNSFSLKKTCKYLNIEFDYKIFSEMNLEIGTVSDPGEWALKIAEALGAKEYINLPGGEEIFDKRKFEKSNIDLKFLKINLKEYNQRRNEFESGLSIIDVMMFNSPDAINESLDDYTVY